MFQKHVCAEVGVFFIRRLETVQRIKMNSPLEPEKIFIHEHTHTYIREMFPNLVFQAHLHMSTYVPR